MNKPACYWWKIYPRNTVNPKRIELFSENLRDGFIFDNIEVEIHPDDKDKYRILDGAHRFKAFRANGYTDIQVSIRNLDGYCALLYSASKAIGPQQLTEEEAKNSISNLSKSEYLSFLKSFFMLLNKNTKPECRIAFIIADWRDKDSDWGIINIRYFAWNF